MTLKEFEKVVADVKRAASGAKVNLADPANPYTVWLENPAGSGFYFLKAMSKYLQDAQAKAGPVPAVIYFVQGGKTQVVIWRDGKWADGYAE